MKNVILIIFLLALIGCDAKPQSAQPPDKFSVGDVVFIKGTEIKGCITSKDNFYRTYQITYQDAYGVAQIYEIYKYNSECLELVK